MKFAVIGGGSMGKRRIRCLLANKVDAKDIRLVDVREDRQAESKEKYGVESLGDVQQALTWGAEALLVCVPGALHMQPALAAAEAGRHVFCEVPLSVNLDGVDRLSELARQKRIVVAPGCQTPFHPLFKQLKSWMGEPSFGKPLMVLAEFGQYLPDWHPYEDYRKFYASNQAMGGGNLDVIAQEMATFYWLLEDRVSNVFCRGDHLSTLEIQANDTWRILADTERGSRITAQFDLIQRAGRFGLKFISETASIELDMVAGTIRRFLTTNRQWETRTTPAGFAYEQCYIDEIALFLQCIAGTGQWHNPLPAAIHVVKFLQAMVRSAAEGGIETLK